jgi:hypothetical protein
MNSYEQALKYKDNYLFFQIRKYFILFWGYLKL